MGAFAVGLGGADVPAAMVLGQSWIEVPEAIAVEYSGELSFGIGGKDVMLKILVELGLVTVAIGRSVGYRSDTSTHFSNVNPLTLTNLIREFRGLNGVFLA